MGDETGGSAQTYAQQVGARLRAIRRQQGLSLHDVDSLSGQEFKASVLGAYERGERVISVPRLQRLAALYHVPVDQLLPAVAVAGAGDGDDQGDQGDGSDAGDAGDDASARGTPGPVTFDLARLAEVDDAQLAMVHRYVDRIALRRQDFNGRVMTIRGEDVRAIAGLFGTDTADLIRRLDVLGVRADRTTS